jgi:L-iditol 2-dehydrogenase
MKPSAKDIALIFGLGPIGLLVATYLEAMQVHVVGVEINEYRAELARRIGVEHVLNPTRADLPKEILRLTAGEGVDQVYECTGKFEVRRQTTGPVRKGGKICLIGMYEGLDERYEPDLIGMEIILKELSLVGVNVFSIQHYWDILEFARRRAIDFGRIITHRFPLERAAEAFALADSGNCGKVILEP